MTDVARPITTGRPSGIHAADNRFGPAFGQLLALRARAAIAAALAETSLVPHPWTRRAFECFAGGIAKAASLYAQVNALARAKDPAHVDPPPKLETLLYIELSYPALPDAGFSWGSEALVDRLAKNKPARGPIRVERGETWMRDLCMSEVGAMVISVWIDDDIPGEARRLIKNELKFQVEKAPSIGLDLKRLNPRLNWKSSYAQGRDEILWDLRVRMAMFVTLFLEQFRRDVCVSDPFVVFFLEPRRIGRGQGGRPSHHRTGLMGYRYIIDAGQRLHLDGQNIHLNSFPEQELMLPFPDGICGSVYLRGTDSPLHRAEDAIKSYSEASPVVKVVEEKMLASRLLLELPVHVADLEALSPDGPELIVTLAIPTASTLTQTEPPNQGDSSNPREWDVKSRIANDLESPMPGVFAQGEVQVLQEVTRRLVGEFVHAPVSVISGADNLVGTSQVMVKLGEDARTLAGSEQPVLILGRPGVGKTLLARHIHEWSKRASRKLIEVEGASLSAELGRSELFGYRKGSHSTATRDRAGIISIAEKSTLFIDDFDALPRDVQAMLLGVMEGREFRRLGDNEGTPADVRFVLATNAGIPALVAAGMRPDFITRFAAALYVPSLFERPGDIEGLARHFVGEYRKDRGIAIDIDPPAIDYLRHQDWSNGEVRALRHVVRLACRKSVEEASSGGLGDANLRVTQEHLDWALQMRPPSLSYPDAPNASVEAAHVRQEINANAAALGEGFTFPSFSAAHCALESAYGTIGRFCREWINANDHIVALTSSATAACEIGLQAVALEAEAIAYTDLAHPNIVGAIRSVARMISKARGSEVRLVEIPLRRLIDETVDATSCAERVAQAVTAGLAGSRAALVIEHVGYQEGIRLPIGAIVEQLDEISDQLEILVDGAQAIGVWKPDRPLRAGYIGCFHKFLGAPPGTAFLALRGEHDLLPHSLACTVNNETRQDFPTTDIAKWEATASTIERARLRLGDAEETALAVASFMAEVEKALAPLHGTLAGLRDASLRSHILSIDTGSRDNAARVLDQMTQLRTRVQALGTLIRVSMGATSRREEARKIGSQLAFAVQAIGRPTLG